MYCFRTFVTNLYHSLFKSNVFSGFDPQRQAKLLLLESLTTFSENTQFCYFVDIFLILTLPLTLRTTGPLVLIWLSEKLS